jgi:hypothetical protein
VITLIGIARSFGATRQRTLRPPAVYYQDAAFSKPIVDNSRYWSGEPQGRSRIPTSIGPPTATGFRRKPSGVRGAIPRRRFVDSRLVRERSYRGLHDAAATSAVAWYTRTPMGKSTRSARNSPMRSGSTICRGTLWSTAGIAMARILRPGKPIIEVPTTGVQKPIEWPVAAGGSTMDSAFRAAAVFSVLPGWVRGPKVSASPFPPPEPPSRGA